MDASEGFLTPSTRAERSDPAAVAFIPDAQRARLYAIWAGWAGIAFFAVYPALNWLTSLRARRFHLYVPAELAIPFVPQFVWPYLSMYVLFLLPLFVLPAARMPALGKQLVAGTIASGLLFVLLPAELGFTRTIPSDPMYAAIYAALFGLDRPHNLVPSLHVVFSSAILFACVDVAGPRARALLHAWFAVIVASTVLVHQHHLLDGVAAIALVLALRRRYGVTYAQTSSRCRTAGCASRQGPARAGS